MEMPTIQPCSNTLCSHTVDYCFGTLGKLPAEIRTMIWCLVPATYEDRAQGHADTWDVGNFTAILRINSCIQKEAKWAFYSNVGIDFIVEPTFDQAWLQVQINNCMSVTLHDLADARARGFVEFLCQPLQEVTVHILAAEEEQYVQFERGGSFFSSLQRLHAASGRDLGLPERPTRVADSTGQMICLFRRCTDIASLLQHAPKGLLDLNIDFQDTRLGNWFNHDIITEEWSEIDFEPTSFGDTYSATRLMLIAFNMIRGARRVRIEAPGDHQQTMEQIGYYLFSHYEALLKTDQTTSAHQLSGDKFLEREKDRIFVDLENVLDITFGPAAQMLRLHRYAFWRSEGIFMESKGYVPGYEEKIERIICSDALDDAQRLYSALAMSRRQLWLALHAPDQGRDWFQEYPDGICALDLNRCNELTIPDMEHEKIFQRVIDWHKLCKSDPSSVDRMEAAKFTPMNRQKLISQLSMMASIRRSRET